MAALDAKDRTQPLSRLATWLWHSIPTIPMELRHSAASCTLAAAAGVSMARDASTDADVVPRCAMVVLALEAFRDARYSEALLWSEQVRETSVLASAIRAASAGELGSGDPNLVLDETGISGPKFRNT
ncbi:hypothetical protein ASC97_27865 [Rhizobium sp. Root1203]|nr:hypothetical protein ASC97_27865 [Rhizobium sp. Root1203]